MRVFKYFPNYFSCYHCKADIFLDVCREFLSYQRALFVRVHLSQSREQKLFPLSHISFWCENLHFTALKGGYDVACDRYQQHNQNAS